MPNKLCAVGANLCSEHGLVLSSILHDRTDIEFNYRRVRSIGKL